MTLRHPSVTDGPIRAWNRILCRWDELGPVRFGLDIFFWPKWIRKSDGAEFETPPADQKYDQPVGG
jgi:hypothetical protein